MGIKSNKITLQKTVQEKDPCLVEDFLEFYTRLDKACLEDVLEKGGFWVRERNKKKLLRCRSGKTKLQSGDRVEMYYDPEILAINPPQSYLIEEEKHWGAWYKPAGLLSQGTKYSDHASILRQVEKSKGQAYLVHRLDREAKGLMIVAYTSQGASLLSKLWQEQKIKKSYLAEVLKGTGPFTPEQGEITIPLDGQKACTRFRLLEQKEKTCLLMVEIETGRLHQIRRQMELIGHPVMGDPLYGKGNKNSEGMMLMSYSLEFIHPIQKKKIFYCIKEGYDSLYTK
ncbi:MAG: RluA family pseudouridine synthase [Candidatus Brocadiae bacterium]|nr:RluA family pseudouridine synthase [Candidatus Brocadiia bacterium]